MEAVELNFLNVLKTDLELSDEKTAQVVDYLKKLQKDNSDSLITDIKSLFKEEFHKLDLKMEQNKSDIDLKFEQQNTKFEQFNTKLDKHRSDIDLKFEQNKSDIDLKFEQFNTKFEQFNTKFEQFNTKFEQFDKKFEQFNTKLEKTKADILKSYLAGLITVVGMILALMATVIFRH